MGGDSDKCSLVFDPTTVLLLQGDALVEPLCRWLSLSRVRITLTSKSHVRPGDLLTVRPRTIHPLAIGLETLTGCFTNDRQDEMSEAFDNCASGSTPVLRPENMLQPKAIITG